MRVNVLMPTLGLMGDDTERSLRQHAPFDVNLITSGIPGWGAAINDCLARREPEHDVLIIDDDVTILPDTFRSLDSLYNRADIFGFKLLFPNGELQHGGGWVTPDGRAGHIESDSDVPSYVAYVTASLCYIKHRVFDTSPTPTFPVWPGNQWEDVAFCMQAWELGHRILYVPDSAIHHETATKQKNPNFWKLFFVNSLLFSTDYQHVCAKLSKKFGMEYRIMLDDKVVV